MLIILLLFGICPMTLNKTKNEVVSKFINLLYISIYTVAITVALGFFGYYAYFTHGIDRIIQDTASISGYSQTIFVVIIFYATIIVGLCHKKAQSKYFNRINTFDEKLISKLNINIENGSVLSYMVYQHIFVIVVELGFYVVGQLLEGFTVYTFTFHVFMGILVLTITLAALHVRNCGIILANRFTILYDKLDRITDSSSLSKLQCEEVLNVFDFVEDLFILKQKFGKSFGFQLLLNSAFDFIYLTIAIYYVLMSLVLKGFQWNEVYKFMAFSLTHIVKNVMIVFVMENLAGQVDKIRKIATKTSLATNAEMSASLDLLFLKLQHMEKTKYITANDFFPINYAMLYNMGAAIVTHMMILLQFQQWEDSQKLLSTSENTTPLAQATKN
ncbi:uncharacterized protein LOC119084796 [Bradysia coprophila]|uniref:uncharacterized protein LOC119084796 n=1 Tax=Bradysia coprophila TaxID=38358 RepID=UPI00187DC3BA|nr:uncharacterized protein LOC119084796 [Bradysia coprophila]